MRTIVNCFEGWTNESEDSAAPNIAGSVLATIVIVRDYDGQLLRIQIPLSRDPLVIKSQVAAYFEDDGELVGYQF